MSDTANNAHVDFGVIRRNPNEGGQSNLMRAGFGRRRAFRMVEFGSSEAFDLDRFEAQLKKPHGGFSWVVGNRGSGKSEIIAHLFRKQISEHGSSRIPRLPLYISIAKGGTGGLDFDRINRLCRDSLIEAVQYLHKAGANNPGHYKTLRHFLSNEKFRTILLHDLQNTHHNIDGVPRETSLTNIMEAISKSSAKNAFRVTLYIDDLDKVDPETAARFLSTCQLDLENLIGEGVRVVFSVSRDFMVKARENLALSFLGLHQWSHKPQEILQVPDLSELTSADVHQLIKRRIHYMHFHEEDGWVSDFRKKPHVNLSDALEDPNWSTYDIRDMRRNSAITTLLSWLSRRNKTYTRDALKAIEDVLNSCPPGSAKRQLQPRQIEDYLKQHNIVETKTVLAEISKRIKGIDPNKLKKERKHLSEGSWRKALEATHQAITLGAWDANEENKYSAADILKAEFKITQSSRNSGIMKFLDFVVEMSDEETEQKILPNVIARTPDDLFALIRFSQMDHILEQEIISQGAAVLPEIQGEEQSGKYGKILDDIHGSLKEAWETEFSTKQIEPADEGQLGDDLALEIVYSIMSYPKRPSRATKPWLDIEKLLAKDVTSRAQFRRTLIQYLALLVDPESTEEKAFFWTLMEALSGNRTLQFIGSPRWRDSADLFETLISRNYPIFTKRWAENLADKCNRDFPWDTFEIEADVKGVKSLSKLTAATLGQDLKFSQPVTFRIKSISGPLVSIGDPSTKAEAGGDAHGLVLAHHMLDMLSIFNGARAEGPGSPSDDNLRMQLLLGSMRASFETKIIVTLPEETTEHFFSAIPGLMDTQRVSFWTQTPVISQPTYRLFSYYSSIELENKKAQFTKTFQLAHAFNNISSFTINPWNISVPFLDPDFDWFQKAIGEEE